MTRATIDGHEITIHYARSGAIKSVTDETTNERLQVFMDNGLWVKIGGRRVSIIEIKAASVADVPED